MPSSRSPSRADPTFLHTRREAAIILLIWLVCLVWTIGYSATFAYEVEPETVPLVWGLPSWVFWGVAVPWAVAGVVSIVFALCFMADDDLGEDPPADLDRQGDDRGE